MEDKYTKIFLEPLYECYSYKPKLGHSEKKEGFSLHEFVNLYGKDPFYAWISLDSPLMYAAHRTAGCMTSLYRQVGIGCERLFREIICDTIEYEHYSSSQWSYTTTTKSGKKKTLSLDGRLEIADIINVPVKERIIEWMKECGQILKTDTDTMRGIVFEVRQGYKSKDSKRQNGDLDNATVAYAYHYLPVFAIFSSQIDNDIVLRYRNNRCGILTGTLLPDKHLSLYAFSKDVLGFDLADFFKSNSPVIKKEVSNILQSLFK